MTNMTTRLKLFRGAVLTHEEAGATTFFVRLDNGAASPWYVACMSGWTTVTLKERDDLEAEYQGMLPSVAKVTAEQRLSELQLKGEAEYQARKAGDADPGTH